MTAGKEAEKLAGVLRRLADGIEGGQATLFDWSADASHEPFMGDVVVQRYRIEVYGEVVYWHEELGQTAEVINTTGKVRADLHQLPEGEPDEHTDG